MLINYLKTAWRSLLANKFNSLINIAGLAIGLAVGILLLLWVQDELSYDGFHPNAANICRLENEGGTGNSRQLFTYTNAAIGTAAKKELPDVVNSVRIMTLYRDVAVKYFDKKIIEKNQIAFVDPSFFSIFDFPLVRGNPLQPFTDMNSMVITEATAKKIFGSADPIAKVITTDLKLNFRITGVIRDFPHNSSIQYDMMVPMALLNDIEYIQNPTSYNGTGRIASMDADWINYSYQTYLQLRPHAPIPLIEKKLRNIHLRNKSDDTDVGYLLQGLRKMHLYKADGSDDGMENVRIFSLIALLILLIACINYVNLSTARSLSRAREVSMRKIIGARKGQLFLQFILETAVLFAVAFLLALGTMYLLMPMYNNFSGKNLSLGVFNYRIWLDVLLTLLLTLAASSIYPAVLLSSFKPLQTLQGKITTGMGSITFRKILVIGQFTVSTILIIGTLVIGKQLKYIKSKNLGYDRNYVFSFRMPQLYQHYDAVKAQLLKQPGIENVTRASGNIVNIDGWTGDNDWAGKEANATLFIHPLYIDQGFIPFFKIRIIKGENFTGSISDSAHFILNETAVREMGFKNPIGKKLRIGTIHGTVIGVVKDFYFASMRKKIEPSVFVFDPKSSEQLYIKTTATGISKAIASAGLVWGKHQSDLPFQYSFLDETFNQLYQTEQHTDALLNIFALLAIFISCLGLFALATYTAQVRTKEMGIRKVLGATAAGIVQLLSKDFLKLVVTAIIIAIPISWWAMSKWLNGYSYRTNIGWLVFALAGGMAIVIALLTMSYQALKAALSNPVKSLRTE
jgi:putative ABC transport system permease protein